MTRKRQLTNEQALTLVKDYAEWDPSDPEDTRTLNDIANKHGVSSSTALRTVGAHGVPYKRFPRQEGKPQADAVALGVAVVDLSTRVRELENYIRKNGLEVPE